MAARKKQDVGGARFVVESVDKMNNLLRKMLERANQMKESSDIEPALTNSDLGDLLQSIDSLGTEDPRRTRQFSIIETAVRDIFNELLASSSIDEPSFVQIWNLLDIVSILADTARCDSPLPFHLIEELLDSQTVAGCRKIFDYLESRRERLVAKNFTLKNLVILRSCNELLRRLSRAEDTAFCGRVFIFLFQSFPLGDKSSVNLRGEYHTENATIFDEGLPSPKTTPDAMQLDTEEPASQDGKKNTLAATSTPKPTDESKALKGSPSAKGVTFDAKIPAPLEKPKDPDTLYPIFWSLQRSFNQPKKLFEPDHFTSFKSGLEDTMVMFKSVPNTGSPSNAKTQSEKPQRNPESRGIKRKRSSNNDDLATTFNPKYLTSRDLFELEISDLSFRRHILVQALIVLDFLLSLSPKAKEKLATVTPQNKSVMYSEQVISEEDTKWALDMKRRISEYLKSAPEGPFFVRMVETVLARDKNWVRWKMESCPSIREPAVGAQDVISAKSAAKKATAYRPLRPQPLKSLDLGFLTDPRGGLERLKNPDGYKLPSLASFEKAIADDDFEIGMTNDEEVKQRYLNAKASKTWRALRIASRTKLSLFEKIDDTSDIRKIFDDNSAAKPEDSVDREAVGEGDDSMEIDNKNESVDIKDRRPIFIFSESSSNTAKMVSRLCRVFPKDYEIVKLHTAKPQPSKPGLFSNYITAEQFAVMRDEGEVLELRESNSVGAEVGFSKKAIEAVAAEGKVPILISIGESAEAYFKDLKNSDMPARFIHLLHPKKNPKRSSQALFDEVIVVVPFGSAYQAFVNILFGQDRDAQLPSLHSRGGDEASLIDELGEDFEDSDVDGEDGKIVDVVAEDIKMSESGPGDGEKVPPPATKLKVETDAK